MTSSSTVASGKVQRTGEATFSYSRTTPRAPGLALFCSKESSVVVPHLQVVASMIQRIMGIWVWSAIVL